MLNSGIVKGLIIAMIAFVFVGIGLLVGGPTMMQGFDATINATNASTFTALQTIGKFGPAIILLGLMLGLSIGNSRVHFPQIRGKLNLKGQANPEPARKQSSWACVETRGGIPCEG